MSEQAQESGPSLGAFESMLESAYSTPDNAAAEQALADSDAIPSGKSPDELLSLQEGEEAPAETPVEAQAEAETEETEEKPLEDTPAFKQLGKKAQGRIRELVDVRKQQEEQLNQFQAQAAQERAQYQQYLQQMQYQQQLQAQQMQAELAQYRNLAESQRQEREQLSLQEKFKNDPVAKFEHEVLSKAEKLAGEKVAAIEERLKAREQQEAQAQAEAKRNAERQQRFAKWDAQLKQVVPSTILKGAEDKDLVSRLAPPLENLLLAYAASAAQEPATAAAEFNQILDQLVDLRAKVRAKAQGQVVAKNKNLPAASGTAKSAAASPANLTERPPPPRHVIQDMGFSNIWEWRRAGSPAPQASR